MIEKLFKSKKPDGIFAAVERYAITSYEVCSHLKLNIPGDVKVISFSNLQAAAFLNPPLTTIKQPAFEIGREAASILFKAVEKKMFKLKNENIVSKSTLIERASTAAVTSKNLHSHKRLTK